MSIQLKRGTSDAKSKSSVTLDAGQPFYETDTKKLYVGDGSTELKNLTNTIAIDDKAAHLSEYNTFTGSNTFAMSTTTYFYGDVNFYGTNKFNTNITLSDPSNSSNPGLKISSTSGLSNFVSTNLNCFSIGQGKLSLWGKGANYYDIKVPDVSSTTHATLVIPEKSGEHTIATTDDIVEFKENNPSLSYKCSLSRECTMWLNGDYCSYCSPGFLAAGFGDGNPTSTKGTVAIGPGGLYMIGDTANRLKFTLPNTAGTVALTSDLPTIISLSMSKVLSTAVQTLSVSTSNLKALRDVNTNIKAIYLTTNTASGGAGTTKYVLYKAGIGPYNGTSGIGFMYMGFNENGKMIKLYNVQQDDDDTVYVVLV